MASYQFTYTLGIISIGLLSYLPLVELSRGPEGMLYRSCMMGYGITGISSTISNITTEGDRVLMDRKWKIDCGRLSYQTTGEFCRWGYEFANEPQANLRWRCPLNNGYLTGIYSEYVREKQDRKWRMECCTSPGVKLVNCRRKSKRANRPRGPLQLNMTGKTVIQAISSRYKKDSRDRIWRFVTCEMTLQYKGRLHQN